MRTSGNDTKAIEKRAGDTSRAGARDARDENRHIPLMISTRTWRWKCVGLLEKAGADVKKDSDGDTALWACLGRERVLCWSNKRRS